MVRQDKDYYKILVVFSGPQCDTPVLNNRKFDGRTFIYNIIKKNLLQI